MKAIAGGYWRLEMRLGLVWGHGNAFGVESGPQSCGGLPPSPVKRVPGGGGGVAKRDQPYSSVCIPCSGFKGQCYVSQPEGISKGLQGPVLFPSFTASGEHAAKGRGTNVTAAGGCKGE